MDRLRLIFMGFIVAPTCFEKCSPLYEEAFPVLPLSQFVNLDQPPTRFVGDG